jgi:hypothetical protein
MALESDKVVLREQVHQKPAVPGPAASSVMIPRLHHILKGNMTEDHFGGIDSHSIRR